MMSGKWFNSKSTAAQHRAVYTKLYYFLKAQRTVLDSILSNLKKLQASSPKTDAKLNEFISLLEKDVLHSDFRTNVFNASKFLIKLKGMNLNQISSFPGYIVKLLNIFSRSCVAFVKIPTMLLSNFKCDKSDNEKNTPIGAIPANNSGDSVICRLCNENIHVDRFEEHIKSCAIAFKSESKVNDINQKLKEEIKLILDKFLKFEWPGEQEFSINVAFPMLHLVILLYQASEIETHADDSLLELDYIESSILMIPIIENIHKKYVTDSIKLLRDKAKLTIALHSATNVLRTTRVSGSAKIITNNSVDINNFDFIKLISSGAYARVFLARNKSTKDIFAIKVTPKSSCTHKNEVVRILTEKDIMLRFNSPYIVNFYYSFTGKKNLYLVMEYLPGGDLYSLLQNVGCFDEDTAKIYTLQILLALQHLHTHGIIHRDLKPDNILVSKEGTIKLTDFGLSHMGLLDRQSSEEPVENEESKIVGTPDYIAPEILMQKHHSFTADYWSLGCILYEFLFGIPPFHSDTEEETFKNILQGEYDMSPETTEDVSKEALDLISHLLIQNPEKRLGAKGIHKIINHSWFEGIDLKTVEPPFKPELSNEIDTEYFLQRYQFPKNSDILEDLNDERDDETSELKNFQAVGVDQIIRKNEEVLSNTQQHLKQHSNSNEENNMNEESNNDGNNQNNSNNNQNNGSNNQNNNNNNQNNSNNNPIEIKSRCASDIERLRKLRVSTNLATNMNIVPAVPLPRQRKPKPPIPLPNSPYVMKRIGAKADESKIQFRLSKSKHRKQVERVSMMIDAKIKLNVFD